MTCSHVFLFAKAVRSDASTQPKTPQSGSRQSGMNFANQKYSKAQPHKSHQYPSPGRGPVDPRRHRKHPNYHHSFLWIVKIFCPFAILIPYIIHRVFHHIDTKATYPSSSADSVISASSLASGSKGLPQSRKLDRYGRWLPLYLTLDDGLTAAGCISNSSTVC